MLPRSTSRLSGPMLNSKSAMLRFGKKARSFGKHLVIGLCAEAGSRRFARYTGLRFGRKHLAQIGEILGGRGIDISVADSYGQVERKFFEDELTQICVEIN